MPLRELPLVTGELYHLINRGIERRPIFRDKRDYRRFLRAMQFYQFISPPEKLSRFLTFSRENRAKLLQQLSRKIKRGVDFICFCLMPNHFHFLLKQTQDGGISKFMSNLQNSFTRYFNTKYQRKGHFFQGQFRVIRIETEE